MDPRKYPRTPHLPFSRSRTSDDIDGTDWNWQGKEVLVTEKMDGECTTFYNDKFHARSMDSKFHPSRSWVAGLWGNISWKIPDYRRIVLENVYAKHSLGYDHLPTFAFGIGVVDLEDSEGNKTVDGEPIFLDWDSTLEIFEDLGITPVPHLYRGQADFKKLKEIYDSLDFSKNEGIVVRTINSFPEADFEKNVGKAVRPGHVQTDQHWLRTWTPNKMEK